MSEKEPRPQTIEQIYQIVAGGDHAVEKELRKAETVLRRIAEDPNASTVAELSRSPALQKEDLIVVFEELGDTTPVDAIRIAIEHEEKEITVFSAESNTPVADKYFTDWYEQKLELEAKEKRRDAARKRNERKLGTTPVKKPKETPLPPSNFIKFQDLKMVTGIGKDALTNILRYGVEKIKIDRFYYYSTEQALSEIEAYKRKKEERVATATERRQHAKETEAEEKQRLKESLKPQPPVGFENIQELNTVSGIGNSTLWRLLRTTTEKVRIGKCDYFNKEQALIYIAAYKKKKAEEEKSALLRNQNDPEGKRARRLEASRRRRKRTSSERVKPQPPEGFLDLNGLEALTGFGVQTIRRIMRNGTQKFRIGRKDYFKMDQALHAIEMHKQQKTEKKNAGATLKKEIRIPPTSVIHIRELEAETGVGITTLRKILPSGIEQVKIGKFVYINKDQAYNAVKLYKKEKAERLKKGISATVTPPEGFTNAVILSKELGISIPSVHRLLKSIKDPEKSWFSYPEAAGIKILTDWIKETEQKRIEKANDTTDAKAKRAEAARNRRSKARPQVPSGFMRLLDIAAETGVSVHTIKRLTKDTAEMVMVGKKQYTHKAQTLDLINKWKKEEEEKKEKKVRKQQSIVPREGFTRATNLSAQLDIPIDIVRRLLKDTRRPDKTWFRYPIAESIKILTEWKIENEQKNIKEPKKSISRFTLPEGYIRNSQLAERFHITPRQMRNRLMSLGGIKIGHNKCFPEEQALALLDKQDQEKKQPKEKPEVERKQRPNGKTAEGWARFFGLDNMTVSKILSDTPATIWGSLRLFDDTVSEQIGEYIKKLPNDKRIYIRDNQQFVTYNYLKQTYDISYYILDKELAEVTKADEPGMEGVTLVSLSEALTRLEKRIDIPRPDKETGIYTDNDKELWTTRFVYKNQYGIGYDTFDKISEGLDVKYLRGNNGRITQGFKISDVLQRAQKITSPEKWTTEKIEEKAWELFLQTGKLDNKTLMSNSSLKGAIERHYQDGRRGLRKFIAEKAEQVSKEK